MTDALKEREAWRNTIWREYKAGHYRRAWLLLAANVGDMDNAKGLIDGITENMDPRPGWRAMR